MLLVTSSECLLTVHKTAGSTSLFSFVHSSDKIQFITHLQQDCIVYNCVMSEPTLPKIYIKVHIKNMQLCLDSIHKWLKYNIFAFKCYLQHGLLNEICEVENENIFSRLKNVDASMLFIWKLISKCKPYLRKADLGLKHKISHSHSECYKRWYLDFFTLITIQAIKV